MDRKKGKNYVFLSYVFSLGSHSKEIIKIKYLVMISIDQLMGEYLVFINAQNSINGTSFQLQPDDTYEEVPEPVSQSQERKPPPPEPEVDDDYESVEPHVPAPPQPEPSDDLYENVAEVTTPAVRFVAIVTVAWQPVA